MPDLALIGIALLGTLLGACVALMPGLHVYSIAALALALSGQNVIPLAN
jgi:TctA family transporter